MEPTNIRGVSDAIIGRVDLCGGNYMKRPERDYDKIEPVHIQEYTHRGFYDVLLNEYILNGRLLRELNYLEEHKGEAGWFVRDLIRTSAGEYTFH